MAPSTSCNAGWHAYAHPHGALCPVCHGAGWADRSAPGATDAQVAWDRLAAEATILAGTIAETLADGVLPEGLWLNVGRMEKVVGHLREAIEAMGQMPEEDDGKVLVAGILYDAVTLDEADPQ